MGGCWGGKPKALTDHQLETAERMLAALNVQGVAEHFGVARSTLYRLLETSPDETGWAPGA